MSATIRNRCCHIGIETPQNDADKYVVYNREGVIEEDGVELGKTAQRPRPIRVQFVPDLVTAVRTVFDPVLGVEVTLSGAALALWIQADFDARQNALPVEP
jgi:hypothetical protein